MNHAGTTGPLYDTLCNEMHISYCPEMEFFRDKLEKLRISLGVE